MSTSDEAARAGGAPGPGDPVGGNGANPVIPGPSAGAPGLPPEKEIESSFLLPVLSGRFVWAANPKSGRVAAIDTQSLQVHLARAGFEPSFLAALPSDGDVLSSAVVLNVRSHDATVLRLTESGIRADRVPTHAGANAWAVSPSGRWAIAWSDALAVKDPDRAESFQEITVIDVPALTATRLSVGYRPSRIFFRDDEARAFVVCEPGISVVELDDSGATLGPEVALSEDGTGRATDVAVSSDGSYALARVDGSRDVHIVEIATGARTVVTLSGPVTDLDLVADGSAAVAVVRGQPKGLEPVGEGGAGGSGSEGERGTGVSGESGGGGAAGASDTAGGNSGASGQADGGAAGAQGGDGGAGLHPGASGSGTDAGDGGQGGAPDSGTPPAPGFGLSEIAFLPLPAAVHDPDAVQRVFVEELVGSVAVSERGTVAVLYTTATALDRVVVLPTAPSEPNYLVPRPVGVRAGVDAVFVAPDGAHAIAVLRPAGSSAIGGAFGLIPLQEALPVKFQTTDAPPTGVAFAPAPTTSAIVTAATSVTSYIAHLPSLLVDRVVLPSLPLSAGIVAERNAAFVVQEHPEGRLSLIDLDTAEERTLTGFELAGGVTP